MIEALPDDARRLQWPAGWPRTPPERRRRAPFRVPMSATIRNLETELRLLGAEGVVISTGVPSRLDGWPRSGPEPFDTGVAVYWTISERQHAIACDAWDRVRDNLHAAELSITALRGLARWGASEIVHRAFSGFVALPPGPGDDWWREVLNVWPSATLEQCEASYRAEAFLAHPDRGESGSAEKMQRLNAAIDAARKVLK